MTPQNWTPKPGDRVRVISHSTVTGGLVNVRLSEVSRTTGAGYAYVRGTTDKFQAGGRQWRPKRHDRSTISTRIEPAQPGDEGVFPVDGMGGSRFARKLIETGREAEFSR